MIDLLYLDHFVVLKLMAQKKGCKTMQLYVPQFSLKKLKNDKRTQFRPFRQIFMKGNYMFLYLL